MDANEKKSRIICITLTEYDEATDREVVVVSHGIDEDSGQVIILPPETPKKLGAVFDSELNEWVIN